MYTTYTHSHETDSAHLISLRLMPKYWKYTIIESTRYTYSSSWCFCWSCAAEKCIEHNKQTTDWPSNERTFFFSLSPFVCMQTASNHSFLPSLRLVQSRESREKELSCIYLTMYTYSTSNLFIFVCFACWMLYLFRVAGMLLRRCISCISPVLEPISFLFCTPCRHVKHPLSTLVAHFIISLWMPRGSTSTQKTMIYSLVCLPVYLTSSFLVFLLFE